MTRAFRAGSILCAVLLVPLLLANILAWSGSSLYLFILTVWQPVVLPHVSTFFETGARLPAPLLLAALQWACVVVVFALGASRLRPWLQLGAAVVTVVGVGFLYHQIIPGFGLEFVFDGP